MKKFEYTFTLLDIWKEREAIQQHMNKHGDEGWELVSVNNNGTAYKFYWKREKP